MNTMDRKDFLEKVCNYNYNPKWQFLGDIPCVVDFYDDSCPPCNAIEPIVLSLSEKYEERIDFYKVDVDKEKQLARELGVEFLPTLVLCPKDDKPIVLQGVATKEDLISKIEAELLNN